MQGEGEVTCGPETVPGKDGQEEERLPGFTYLGQIERGHASGQGSLQFGALHYTGGFLDGRPHGQGTLTSLNPAGHAKKGGVPAAGRPIAVLNFRHGMRTDVFDDCPGGQLGPQSWA